MALVLHGINRLARPLKCGRFGKHPKGKPSFLCDRHRAVLAALHGAQPHAQEFGNRCLGADLPALAKTVAISAPMPREAPVTRALLPCRLNRLAWSGIG